MYDQQFELWFLCEMDAEGDGSTDPYDPAHKQSDRTGRYTRMGIAPAEQIANNLPMDFPLDAAKEYFHRVHWEPVVNYLGRDVNPVCYWCLADVSVQSGFDRVLEYWDEQSAVFSHGLREFAPHGNSDYAGRLRFALAFLRRRSRGYRDITRPKVNAARKNDDMTAEAAAWRHLSGWTSRRLNLVLLDHLMRPGAPCMSNTNVRLDDSSDLTLEIQHFDQGEWQRLQRAREQVKQEKAALDAHRYKVIEDIADAQRNAELKTAPQLERSGPALAPQEKHTKKPPKWMRWLKAVGVGLGVAGVSVAGPAMDVAGPLIEAVTSGASVKDAVIGGVAGWLFDRSDKSGR